MIKTFRFLNYMVELDLFKQDDEYYFEINHIAQESGPDMLFEDLPKREQRLLLDKCEDELYMATHEIEEILAEQAAERYADNQADMED